MDPCYSTSSCAGFTANPGAAQQCLATATLLAGKLHGALLLLLLLLRPEAAQVLLGGYSYNVIASMFCSITPPFMYSQYIHIYICIYTHDTYI